MVVSGPPGSGKTTLARALARSIGCPAICRDDIKEGMAVASSSFVPAPGDELTKRTFPVFFEVIGLLLRAGVTTVAEAAFVDRVWRPRLEPLRDLASLRVVHCVASASIAAERVRERSGSDASRRHHPDVMPDNDGAWAARYEAFEPLRLDVPMIDVDTTDGYRPDLAAVTDFALGTSGASPCR